MGATPRIRISTRIESSASVAKGMCSVSAQIKSGPVEMINPATCGVGADRLVPRRISPLRKRAFKSLGYMDSSVGFNRTVSRR